MTDATISTTSAVSAPSLPYLEETVKAEVAKALAEAKADESKVVSFVKTAEAFVKAHFTKAVAAGLGYTAAHFHFIEAAFKLI